MKIRKLESKSSPIWPILFLALVFSVFSWEQRFSDQSFDYVNALQKSRHLASEDHIPEAISIAQKLIKKFPDHPYYLQHLAELYAKIGDSAKQAEVIKHLIESSPMAVAQETCPLKIPHGNIVLLQKCAERLPDDPDTLVYLAMAQIRAGNDIDAKLNLEHAQKLTPEYADIYIGLAQIAKNSGDRTKAFENYSKAMSLRPNDSELQKIIHDFSPQTRGTP